MAHAKSPFELSVFKISPHYLILSISSSNGRFLVITGVKIPNVD